MAARKRIQQKIRSQRGASLTWGLLMFLVCAVIGSVVLTAGTAAAGRLSRMAETEQRYYAVNSAAELLAERLTERAVTWKQSQDIYVDNSYTIRTTISYVPKVDEEGNEVLDGEGNREMVPVPRYEYIENPSIPVPGSPFCDEPKPVEDEPQEGFVPLLNFIAECLLYGKDRDPDKPEKDWDYREKNPNETINLASSNEGWKIKLDGFDSDKVKNIDVMVIPTLRITDGSPELEFIIKNDDTETNQYSLRMRLSLDESSYLNQVNGPTQLEKGERKNGIEYPPEEGTFVSWEENGQYISENTFYSFDDTRTDKTSQIQWKVTDLTVEGKMSNESNP